ncbi:MAG: pyridoxal-phosphate dependent enzyme [Phycisphaerae bacterium]|nr:pyridoxal-phosphate dependent enzyme [Phycisphaerae bacterium]NUQ45777.1 pyridoxal-phosphate dependent enzyme [Phycisphaerae bacterium]
MQSSNAAIANAVARCRERGVIIPTFAQLRDPSLIPQHVNDRLRHVGLWDVDPVNLFRITWKNEPVERGGLFNQGNTIEFPPALTGVPARIIGLVGRHFPTGAHKVGAAFGCLVPRLVTGQFDPTAHKAVWPSTGNYCRGGAYDCALLGCSAVAILPEEMSRERFDWLKSIGAEVIRTPGCESNVKEIYDKCWEIRRTRPDCVIFNQFEEFGNAAWHYHVTGGMICELFDRMAESRCARAAASDEATCRPGGEGKRSAQCRLAAFVSATGSAGTIAAGDNLKTCFPAAKIVAVEALQCPTLLQCGFGGHRIEGIGDKHVPWIHNVRNTDLVVAVDDEQCISLMRLFNEDAGRAVLEKAGISRETIERLPDIGISSICNLVAAIKTARYYELDDRDVIFLPLTDSMELYGSRIDEYRRQRGAYTGDHATADFARYLAGVTIDHMRELTYYDRKTLHHFKYFTWVEQQQRSVDDLRRLWDPEFWTEQYAMVDEWDRAILEFNAQVGLERVSS